MDSPKWGSSNMQKCNFKPKCANSMLKFFCQNLSISENAREALKNLQFVCKIWYKSGNGKRGVMVWTEEKRGSLGVRSEYKKGSRPYWQALNVNWHMGVPPRPPHLAWKKKKKKRFGKGGNRHGNGGGGSYVDLLTCELNEAFGSSL